MLTSFSKSDLIFSIMPSHLYTKQMTKIFSITCSKNEADIIETFVRVNSRIVDIFIFIDDSKDTTREILNKLKEEGFNIFIFSNSNQLPYDQGIFMTSGLREGVKLGHEHDIYVPLDCDEFLTNMNRQDFISEISLIPKDHVGFHYWMTYIPVNDSFSSAKENSLKKCFKQKEKKDPNFGKIIIPYSIASKIIINTGSHRAHFIAGDRVKTSLVTCFLAHFPVRDSQQIIKKTISAIDGLIRKKNRRELEGHHVYDLLAYIIREKFIISLMELQKMAYNYAERNETKNIVLGDHPSWMGDYELKYQNLIKSDQTKYLAEIIINMWKSPLLESECLELQNKLFLNQ
jgi:hypothetical protein